MAKKFKPRARPKTGLDAIPEICMNNWHKFSYYFHYEVEGKLVASIIKNYLKSSLTKEQNEILSVLPEYTFTTPTTVAACIHWENNLKKPIPEKYKGWQERCKQFFLNLVETGKEIIASKSEDSEDEQKPKIVISPIQRLKNKIGATVIAELEDLEDAWNSTKTGSLDLYTRFKVHGLSGSSVETVREWIEFHRDLYNDAYKGNCEQAVEAYSYLGHPELKRRIKEFDTMLLDLDKIKNAAKATRKTRVKKPRTADKQISKMNYEKENTEYKLVSINPTQIVGAHRLFVFNTKTKEIIEYVSSSTNGLEVKGSTLQNIGEESRKTRLRKPNDFLPIVQSKTARQIDNEWKKLTTKSNQPNGRLNQTCILLRVMSS